MKKEENKESSSNNSSKPFNIVFTPHIAYVTFKTKMKLQIALHRSNKFCKTSPMKFLPEEINVDGGVLIQNQELAFLTTLQQTPETKLFQPKTINVQGVCQIDGRKYDLEDKINIKDHVTPIKDTSKFCLKLSQDPQIKLVFKIKINEESNAQSKTKIEEASVKAQQFRAQNGSPNQKSISKQRKNITKQKKDATKQKKEDTPVANKNEKHNNQDYYEKLIIKMKQEYQQRENDLKKKCIAKMKEGQSQKQIEMKNKFNKITEGFERKIKDHQEKEKLYEQKYKKMQSQYQQISTQKKQLEKNLSLLEKKNEEVNRSCKDLEKANQDIKKNMSSKILSANQHEKSLEQQLRSKVQRIHSLEKQVNNLKQSNNHLEKRIKLSEQSEQEVKKKYHQSEKNNLSLTEQITSLSYQKEKYKKQITELSEKLKNQEKEYEQEIQNLHSQKKNHSTRRDGGQIQKMKNKILNLQKQLESKKELLKVIGSCKQNKENDMKTEYEHLKKQNQKLKKQINTFQQQQNKDNSLLVLKLAHQKLRRECDQIKKSEKALLIDKSTVQTKLKTLQQDVIKSKEVIATVINLIQQHGDQDLYTLVSDCIG